MGLFARLSKCLSTKTSTSVYFVSSGLLQFIHFLNFAFVLRMSWCACGLGIFIFFTSWTYQFWGSQMQWMGAFVSTPHPILFNFWCIPVLLFIFIPCHLKMRGYGIPSVQKFALGVRPEVRPSVRPSVTI